MSQYPSPYNPPPFPQNLGYSYPQGNQLSAARRASTLMFVLGGLILLMGIGNTLTALAVSADELLQRQTAVMPAPPSTDFQLSANTTKIMAVVAGFATIITGGVYLTLAIGVRRGGKVSTIVAIIITSLILLMIGLMTLTFVVLSISRPAFLPLSCLTGFVLALLIWQLIWLIGAARNTGQLSTAEQQYRMQYWQYQQNMQAYSGYGYAQSAPAASPPDATSPSAAPPDATPPTVT